MLSETADSVRLNELERALDAYKTLVSRNVRFSVTAIMFGFGCAITALPWILSATLALKTIIAGAGVFVILSALFIAIAGWSKGYKIAEGIVTVSGVIGLVAAVLAAIGTK